MWETWGSIKYQQQWGDEFGTQNYPREITGYLLPVPMVPRGHTGDYSAVHLALDTVISCIPRTFCVTWARELSLLPVSNLCVPQ